MKFYLFPKTQFQFQEVAYLSEEECEEKCEHNSTVISFEFDDVENELEKFFNVGVKSSCQIIPADKLINENWVRVFY